MVFDPWFLENPNDPCSGAGYGKFIHISWADRRCDHVQDDMWRQGGYRDNETAGPHDILPARKENLQESILQCQLGTLIN
jgi:hypothetical protein